MGEGLSGSAGGSDRLPWFGPRGAGSIVVLLALEVAISNADWRERVGEGGGETTLSSVSVSISSPVGGGGMTSVIAVERLRGGGDGRLSQSLCVAVCSAPQLTQWGGRGRATARNSLRVAASRAGGVGTSMHGSGMVEGADGANGVG